MSLAPLGLALTLGGSRCWQSHVATAVAGPTGALDPLVAPAVEVVVEGELCAWCDVSDGKDADTGVSVDSPLLGLAVGIAGVVHEARQVSPWPRVDDAVPVQGEEVEVAAVLQVKPRQAALAFLLVDDLPDVLHDEVARSQGLVGAQAPAPPLGPYHRHLGVLAPQKVLVFAVLTGGAQVRAALVQQQAVKAVCPARILGGADTNRHRAQVQCRHRHLPHRPVDPDHAERRRLGRLVPGPALLLPRLCRLLQGHLKQPRQALAARHQAAAIALLKEEHVPTVGPVVVVRAVEAHRKLPDRSVLELSDIDRHLCRAAHLGRPPAVAAQLDPDDVAILRVLERSAVTAQEGPFGGCFEAQAALVEGGRTALAAEEVAPR
uniref:Putative histone lysine n methyltransferase nsd3 n=1 Tax=Ixodes ricinus TaxID=34613 RepID=A0A6B0VA19_IXORI